MYPTTMLKAACGAAAGLLLVSAASGAEPRAQADSPQPPARVYEMPETPGARMSDAEIADAVRKALQAEPLIRLETLNVSVGSGIATLSGAQPVLLARERAALLAQRAPGVHQVVNEIEVQPLRDVSGDKLATDIRSALEADPAIARSQLTVQASDAGAVSLSGTVYSGAERYIAEQIVKTVVGVTAVDDQMQVRRPEQRTDAQIAADVRRMLQWRAPARLQTPEVAVRDGVVTLRGQLSNDAEKRRAAGLAWVAGVKHVDVTPLQIAEGRAPGAPENLPGRKLALQSDEAIAAAVREAIRADARLNASNIDVRVQDRVVILSGAVNSEQAKQTAGKLPYGLLGVASVDNRLDVREESVALD